MQFLAGEVYDYSSIEIKQGATVEILPGQGWTIFGVTGNMIIRGRIIAKSDETFGTAPIMQAPDGQVFSHPTIQKNGGKGGDSQGCGMWDVAPGQEGHGGVPSPTPSNGNGGGGAVVSGSGGPGGRDQGGLGGTATNAGAPDDVAHGGAGATGFSSKGTDGGTADAPTHDNQHFGGGGGGGTRGKHGQLLYFHVGGNFNGSGGLIDVSGADGGAGGNGGNASHSGVHVAPYPGGGGGGGAGGSGGAIVLRYGGGFIPSSFHYNGGHGGVGGQGGIAAGNSNWRACNGKPGEDGAPGVLDRKHL